MSLARGEPGCHALSVREPPLHGETAPGFERVADVFRENFTRRGEVGAALFVYQGGQPVVDLWGGYADRGSQRPWERDTLCVTFSTTKGLVSTCLLALADRGKLEVDGPVADVWPEFSRAGKQAITVRQLLNHCLLYTSPSPRDLSTSRMPSSA